MDEVVVFKVSPKYKNEISNEVATLSALESEAVIRIGLHGLHVILKECPIQNNKQECMFLIQNKSV
jgi:hypothetical protein